MNDVYVFVFNDIDINIERENIVCARVRGRERVRVIKAY